MLGLIFPSHNVYFPHQFPRRNSAGTPASLSLCLLSLFFFLFICSAFCLILSVYLTAVRSTLCIFSRLVFYFPLQCPRLFELCRCVYVHGRAWMCLCVLAKFCWFACYAFFSSLSLYELILVYSADVILLCPCIAFSCVYVTGL
jgi:hypothetical protein